MSFVTGRLCSLCKTFVVNNGKEHICLKNMYTTEIPTKIAPSNSLFDISDEESILDTSIQSDKPTTSSAAKVTKKDGVSKEDFAELISIIETSKPIWDHRLSLGERAENIKNNMWNEVFVKFNGRYSLLKLKSSWKYIRERYTREKKLSASGSAGGNKKRWKHFKSLQFLDDVLLVQKRTTDNITASDSLINEATPPLKRSKKTTIENYMGSLIEELKLSRPVTPTEPVFLAPEPATTEDQNFTSYLAGIMLEIPRQKKIKLQGKILAMVIEELSAIP